MYSLVNYGGWPNCVRLAGRELELIATTDVGPRIIRCGFIGEANLFKEYSDRLGLVGGEAYRNHGGHRLWHAPEIKPRTYSPDNDPVDYAWDGTTLRLTQRQEPATGIVKELEVTPAADANRVTVLHRLVNNNPWAIELAPWSLSVMAPGGRAIFPQEPYRPHEEYLLPARPLVLWHYTDMSDPRWVWGKRYVQLRQDPGATNSQKVGLLNTLGWAAYYLNGTLFLKRYGYDPAAVYPDFGCNTETYTDHKMLEVETLGPLTRLAPGTAVTHVEQWFLHRLSLGEQEDDLDEHLLPLVRAGDQFLPPARA